MIQLGDNDSVISEGHTSTIIGDVRVELKTSNTDSPSCSGRIYIEYSLQLKNISVDINGLLITCGVHFRASLDQPNVIDQKWYYSHTAQLRVGEYNMILICLIKLF